MKYRLRLPVFSQSLLIFVIGIFVLTTCFGSGGADAYGSIQQSWQNSQKASDSVLMLCQPVTVLTNPLEKKAKNEPLTNFSRKSEKPIVATQTIRVVVTGYSSSSWQTDDTPYITANGTYVHDGVVANNGFPFGTEIRLPELYGDKIFSVEDRMHWRKGDYHFDIWFPTDEQAKNFGVKYVYAEILDKQLIQK